MSFVESPRRWPWYILALMTAALDQGTKALWGNTDVRIIPGLLGFHPMQNTGVAFGLLPGRNTLLIVLSLIACAALAYVLSRRHIRMADRLGCALMLGGALGNLIDRVTTGYVVDFIALELLPFFPIFNLADVALVGGMVWMLAIDLWTHRRNP